MIPVEDPAGGAALIFHDQPERTPNKHTDQIAHIEQNAYQKQVGIGENAKVFQKSQGGDQPDPQQHHLVSGAGGGDDILFQRIPAESLQGRLEPLEKYLVGSQCDVFCRDQLLQHIQHPQDPQHMEPGKFTEKVEPLENIVALKICYVQ